MRDRQSGFCRCAQTHLLCLESKNLAITDSTVYLSGKREKGSEASVAANDCVLPYAGDVQGCPTGPRGLTGPRDAAWLSLRGAARGPLFLLLQRHQQKCHQMLQCMLGVLASFSAHLHVSQALDSLQSQSGVEPKNSVAWVQIPFWPRALTGGRDGSRKLLHEHAAYLENSARVV